MSLKPKSCHNSTINGTIETKKCQLSTIDGKTTRASPMKLANYLKSLDVTNGTILAILYGMENIGLQIKWTWRLQLKVGAVLVGGGIFLKLWFNFVCWAMTLPCP